MAVSRSAPHGPADETRPLAGRRLAFEVVFFVAMMSTALSLGGALAHAYALPNKIGLPEADYFVAQRVYDGWVALGIVIALQLASLVTLAVLTRGVGPVVRPVVVAVLCVAAAQLIFWIWTYPANAATDNWHVVPANWQALRARWEYSHLAGAVFELGAMAAVCVAALAGAGRLPER